MPRVLLVAEHASARFGGEAILPIHYFRLLRQRGIEAWMIVHDRTRDELLGLFPDDVDRLHFVADSCAQRMIWQTAAALPARLGLATVGYAMRLISQRHARRIARDLIGRHGIDVIHQPIPVSPKEPSLLAGMDVPVVMGPMNGGMTFPPAFRQLDNAVTRRLISAARMVSHLAHRAIPGKLQAETLLVANHRTRRALPVGVRGRIVEVVENGVDLNVWSPCPEAPRKKGPAVFTFLGRLVDWKAADILLEAFARLPDDVKARLEIVGQGPERERLEQQVKTLGLTDRVQFVGWVAQDEAARRLRQADVLLLPSVYECGGAVVLEAMACSLPVIASAWGGPTDYLDDTCGILVPPDSREGLISGFTAAITRLAQSPELRRRMGAAGRKRVVEQFDWEIKIERMLEVYQETIARFQHQKHRRRPEQLWAESRLV